MVPGGDVLQLRGADDLVEPLGGVLVDDHIVTGIGAVRRADGHSVRVVIGRALLLIVVGDILNERAAGNDGHHLLAAADRERRHVFFEAVGHEHVVRDIARGVDLFALVLFLLGDLEQRRTHILAAGEEHAIDGLHHSADVAGREILFLHLVGVFLLEHSALFEICGFDLALGIVLHRRARHLIELDGDGADGLEDRLVGVVILAVIGPADADDWLVGDRRGIFEHLLEHRCGHGLGGLVGQAVHQAGPDGHVVIVRRPVLQQRLVQASAAQDHRGRFQLCDSRVGRKRVLADAVDDALGVGEVDRAFKLAALGNILECACILGARFRLRGEAHVLDDLLRHFGAGQRGIGAICEGGNGETECENKCQGEGRCFQRQSFHTNSPSFDIGRHSHAALPP